MHVRPLTLATVITAHRLNQECGDVIMIGAIWGHVRDVCVSAPYRHTSCWHSIGWSLVYDFTPLRSKLYCLFATFTYIVDTGKLRMEIISHGWTGDIDCGELQHKDKGGGRKKERDRPSTE